MKKLTVDQVSFQEVVKYGLIGEAKETINNFTFEFEFGKSYCINSQIGQGGWGLSWLLSGMMNHFTGDLKLDNCKIDSRELKRVSCTVGISGKKFIFWKSTVREEINLAVQSESVYSLEQLVAQFHLSEGRLGRPLESLSAERWRAGIAIGVAQGKKVFCFPWMDNWTLSNYNKLWFEDMLQFLKDQGFLIIIPTVYTEEIGNLFDEVIHLPEKP